MVNFTIRTIATLLTFGFFALASVPGALAQQVKHASSVADQDLGCIIVCGSIANSGHAVDSNASTAASISPPLAIGKAALRLGFDAPVPSGAKVNMLVSFTGSALSLGLVNNTSISTFSANGSRAKQTVNMNTVLNRPR